MLGDGWPTDRQPFRYRAYRLRSGAQTLENAATRGIAVHSQDFFVHTGQAPLDDRLKHGLEPAPQLGEAVFDLWGNNVVLLAMNEPSMLKLLELAAQDSRSHWLAQRAFE